MFFRRTGVRETDVKLTTAAALLLCSAAGADDAARALNAAAAPLDSSGLPAWSPRGDEPVASMTISGQSQMQYLFNNRDQARTDDGMGNLIDDKQLTTGFQLRRTKLEAKGHVFEDWINYKIAGAFSRSSGTPVLEDAYATIRLSDDWTAKVGQFKPRLLREESVSSSRQLTTDRSVTNAAFSQGRAQGVELAYQWNRWSGSLAFSDGVNTANTVFNAGAEADLAFTFDLAYRFGEDPAGFKRFDDFTSFKYAPRASMLRGALHWQDGNGFGGSDDHDIVTGTIDYSIEGDGWNAFVATIVSDHERPGEEGALEWGLVLQGGYFFNEHVEGFTRFDHIRPDNVPENGAGTDHFNSFAFGANYYFIPESHAAKFTGEVRYFPNDQRGSDALVSPSTATGVLRDTEGNQITLVLQMQLLF